MAKSFRTLVVSYSRTGLTKKVADLVAEQLGAEKIEEVSESVRRIGWLGYLRSAWEASVETTPLIQSPQFDPAEFDVVVLAAPVWMSKLASPMRTYLVKMERRLPRIAFIVTEGGSGGHRVLQQMRELCHKMPLTELVITEDEIRKSPVTRVKAFCEKLASQYEKEVRPIAVSVKKAVP